MSDPQTGKLHWSCEMCGASGTVAMRRGKSWDAADGLDEAHKELSPECPVSWEELTIEKEEWD